METGYFITGTDTGIGKTIVTVALMRYFRKHGKRVAGMKPVASGCTAGEGGLRNEDALLLQKNATRHMPYQWINPYAFEPPVSPDIAAREAGIEIDFSIISENFQKLKSQADIILVEGVGGWLVPLSESADVAGLAGNLNLPVILVVGIRLGCINHARLSYAAIRASGLPCRGWVANCTEVDMLLQDACINTIAQQLETPLLGVVQYSPDILGDNISNDFNLL